MSQQRFLFHVGGDEPMQQDLELVAKERAGSYRPDRQKTYAQARVAIFRELARKGWQLSPMTLKVPHATHPEGHFKLWFKPQAVHYGVSSHGRFLDASLARSLHGPDIRKVPAEYFVGWVEQFMGGKDIAGGPVI